MVPEPDEKIPQEGFTKNARFLYNLVWSTAQALLDTVGPDRAFELMKPYLKFHFDAGDLLLKNKFNLKLDDLYSRAVANKFSNLFIGAITGNYQFFEQGYTWDILYCPNAHLSEMQCQLNKHIFEGTHGDFETTYTRMLVRGDPYCQLMEKRKGYTIWGEVEKKPLEVTIPKLSYEELEYWQCAVCSQLWIYSTNALVDFAGKEKAVEIIRPYMKALGISIANDLSNELGIKERDALAIASIIDKCNQAANQKGSYTFHTPDKVEKEITECIFANASQDICAEALAARSSGICEAINPEFKFIPLKRMCKGDKTCKWVIMKH